MLNASKSIFSHVILRHLLPLFAGQVTPCKAGEFSPLLESDCQKCVSGYFSLPGARECSVCPAGQYTSGPGQSTCSPCPAGFACPVLTPPAKWVLAIKGCRCQTGPGFEILPTGYETVEKCGQKCLDINQYNPEDDKKCVSFFLSTSGVCEIASCSFGFRPDRVKKSGGSPVFGTAVTYPKDGLSGCPVGLNDAEVKESYELPRTCVMLG